MNTAPEAISTRWRALTLALASFAVAAAGYSAWRQNLTYDEPHHLAWSRRLLESRETERLSDLHYNSKTPVVVPHVVCRQIARRYFGVRDVRWLRFWARLPTVAELGLLLVAVFVLTRRHVGETAAHLATSAAALDPNLIAHGSLATADLPYALATLLTLSAGAAFALSPSIRRGALLGLCFGLALTAKFSALLLLPGFGLAALVLRPLRRGLASRPARMLAGLAMAAAVAVLILCAAYGFVGVGVALHDWAWRSRWMTTLARALPDLRLPLPLDLLTGIDLSVAGERKSYPVVLLGERHPYGVWYYFVVVWAVKTPLLIAAATLFGLYRAVRARVGAADPWVATVILNLLLSLGYFSLLFHAQVGFRFVLMCVPLLLVVAAAGLAAAPTPGYLRLAGVVAVLLAVAENAAYLGNSVAFTNAAVWPKRQAFRILADSNIDWGQNDDKLEECVLVRDPGSVHFDPVHILPGRNVLSLNIAAGVAGWPRHLWMRRHLDPFAHFRHTLLFFDVSDADHERFIAEARRFAPNGQFGSACPDAGSFRPLVSGMEVVAPTGLRGHQADVLCVRASDTTDLTLLSGSGRITIGRVEWRRRDWERLMPGQRAQFRLEPGLHVFGLTGPRAFAGSWLLSREVSSCAGAVADFQTAPGPGQGYLRWPGGSSEPASAEDNDS